MPRKVVFAKATYLGGLPDTKPSKASTYLWVTDLGIGHGPFGPRDRNFIAWDRTPGVGFESGAAAESRADNVAVFGVELTRFPADGFLSDGSRLEVGR